MDDFGYWSGQVYLTKKMMEIQIKCGYDWGY